jgi:ubiquinone/menaquinone biosynthesis C-methylase UbiE
LAHLRAIETGREIFYSQQNMEQTDFPDGYFDLIHTTFIQHELPVSALKKVTAEAFRILAPGGFYVNLDFHNAPGGMFGKLIHFGHARRNNEVFMRGFHETDYLQMLREAGFISVEMLPFDDGTGISEDISKPPANWRFPWQLFVAKK